MIIETAIQYAAAGLSVLPIAGDGTKQPRGDALPNQSWTPLTKQIAPANHLRGMFGRNGIPTGIGIIGGKVSGNLEILDIDDPADVEPYRTEVEAAAPGLLAKLPQVRTPRPGLHIYYRHAAEPQGNQKLAQTEMRPQFNKTTGQPVIDNKTGKQKIAPDTLIETRGEGGYVLAPGCPGACHPTGRTYEHVGGPPLTEMPTITADDRNVLLSVARSFTKLADEPTAPSKSSKSKTPSHTGDTPGNDYSARTSWEEILEPYGWEKVTARGDVTKWRRAGKGSGGISATTGLKSKAGAELLCVFSSNAHPFEIPAGKQCGTFNKFGAYSILNHAGDFTAAAKHLASQGFKSIDPSDTGIAAEDAEEITLPPILTYNEMEATYKELRPPIIEGVLRRGETLNITSSTKIGKSWLATGLGICVVTGRKWLGMFDTSPGGVLILDNELHPETSTNRIYKVANAMMVPQAEFGEQLRVCNMRGCLLDIHGIAPLFDSFKPGDLNLIVLDAGYRCLPEGTDENSNSDMTAFYNQIDCYAKQLDCAFAVVLHTSKGNQASKNVTDLGSGAGAQSRATDSHVVLRQHEEPGAVVLEAAMRSWKPLDPCCLSWSFPVFNPAEHLDPTKLKQEKPRRGKATDKAAGESPREPDWTVERYAAEFIPEQPCLEATIVGKAIEHKFFSASKAAKWLRLAIGKGLAHQWKKHGPRDAHRYASKPQPELPISPESTIGD